MKSSSKADTSHYSSDASDYQPLSEATPADTTIVTHSQGSRVYQNDALRAEAAFLGFNQDELDADGTALAIERLVKKGYDAQKTRDKPKPVGVDLLGVTNRQILLSTQDGYSKTWSAIHRRASGSVGNLKYGRTDALYQRWVIDAQLETDAEWFGGLRPTHLIQPIILRQFYGVRNFKEIYFTPFEGRRWSEVRFILYHPTLVASLPDLLTQYPEWTDAQLIPDFRDDHGKPSKDLWDAILEALGVGWEWTHRQTQPILNLQILHYWSSGDLRALLGDNALQLGLSGIQVKGQGGKQSLNPTVSAKRTTRVELYLSPRVRVITNDCSGIGLGGLEEKLARVGLSTETKKTVAKREKSRLDVVAETDLQRFLDYSLGDVGDMQELQVRESNKLQKIAHEVLGIRYRKAGKNPRAVSMPKSTGACVAGILEAFVLDRISPERPNPGDSLGVVDYTLIKDLVKGSGTLVPTLGQSELRGYEAILRKNEGRPLSEWQPVKEVKWDRLEEDETQSLYHARSRFINTVLDAGASTTLAYRTDSAVNLAVVAGGRCNNERPYKLGWQGSWINPDMSGCYGNALRDFEYPVGKPRVWAWEDGKQGIPLGEFLKQFERELVDNLWVASLWCEKMPFVQDLLYSKPIDPLALRKTVLQYLRTDDVDYEDPGKNPWLDLDTEAQEQFLEGGSEPTVKRLPSEMILLREELINAPLTSNSLEVLKAVCTKREWSAFLKEVRVKALVYYPKSERVSLEEFRTRMATYSAEIEAFETPSGTYNAVKRPEFWTTIPLVDFVGPLLDDRKRIKKAMKATKDPKEKVLLNGEQTFLKLVINTTYGVLCSIFFDVSNAVLASNITDRARVGAWQMAKSLGCVHTITDGGYFDADRVPVLRPRREGQLVGMEGLATLFLAVDSRAVKRWADTNNCTYSEERLELPDGVRIPEVLQKLRTEGEGRTIGMFMANGWDDRCSDVVLARIKEFWAPYGLGFNYGIENKDTEYTDALAYSSRSDYFFIDHTGKEQAKIRGTVKGLVSDWEDELENGRFKLSEAKLLPGTDETTLPDTINNEPVKRRFMRAVHRWIVESVWEWDPDDTVGLQSTTMKLALWKALDGSLVAPNCNYHKVLRNFAINDTHFPMPDYKTAKKTSRRLSSDSLYERHLKTSPKKMLDAMISGKLAG